MNAMRRVLIKRTGFFGVALTALTVGLLLGGSQSAWAKAKHLASAGDVTPTLVTTCGTYSGNGQIYLLQNNLAQTGSSSTTCITLSGHDSILDLLGHTIIFTGTNTSGSGLNLTGNQDVVEGDNATISGYSVGVLDTGTNNVGDSVNMTGNGIGLKMSGSFAEQTESWFNFSADSNTKQGVFLSGCTDECTLSDFDASSNGADGVLVQGSEDPRIGVFTADSNGGAGVHVGCPSGCGSNSTVKIYDAPVGFPSGPAVTGNVGDGIFLDKSEANKQDQVIFNFSSGNTGIDMHDASTTCGNNHWEHNTFTTSNANGTSSPACIQ